MRYIRSIRDPQQQYILEDTPLSIGRSAQNTIVLKESTVSRFHARIEQIEQQTLLIDLNSTGGTYVNGKRIISQHILAHGDEIKIGSSLWQFLSEPTPSMVATPNSKAGYIFISYSRVDSKSIDTLTMRLNQAGYRVWVDRIGIGGGEYWRQEIVEAIENCAVFILALSPHSIKSDNVRKEVDLAESAKCKVFPVELQPITDLPTTLKYQLAGVQRINLATNFDAGVRELINAIESETTPTSAPWTTQLTTTRSELNPWLKLLFLVIIVFTCLVLVISIVQR